MIAISASSPSLMSPRSPRHFTLKPPNLVGRATSSTERQSVVFVCLDPFATLFPESLVPGSICNAKTYLPRTCSVNADLLPTCCKLFLPNHDGGGGSPPILTLRLPVLVETPISSRASALSLALLHLFVQEPDSGNLLSQRIQS